MVRSSERLDGSQTLVSLVFIYKYLNSIVKISRLWGPNNHQCLEFFG